MMRRIVTARIWFWQARTARAAGWYVRRPDNDSGKLRWFDPIVSPRLTIARFFDLSVPVKVEYRLDGNLAEIVADLGGGAGEFEGPGPFNRCLHHLLMAAKPVSHDVTHSFLRKYGVHLSYDAGSVVPRGISLNQALYLIGQPNPVHSIAPKFERRLSAVTLP
jgi:hypothetical protein